MYRYTDKEIKTESKSIKIIRETKSGVFVRPNNVKLYKDIYIAKDDLELIINDEEIYFKLEFKKVWTQSNFKLNALGFKGDLNARRKSMMKFV